MPRARRGCTTEHLHGITMSGLHFKDVGKCGGAAPGLTAIWTKRGRPAEGEEVDEHKAIREMAAAFPPGRHLLCEDGRVGRTKVRSEKGLQFMTALSSHPGELPR